MTDMRLLDDMPECERDTGTDAFHHKVYAEVLHDIFMSNRPGISVALFGKWGKGKSTIVNLLKGLIGEKATVVVFNAWKARGDSVRRQLLLAILEIINADKAKEFKKFAGLELAYELIQSEEERERGQASARKTIVKDFFLDPNIRKPCLTTAASLLLIVLFTLLAAWHPAYGSLYESMRDILLIPALGGLFFYVVRTVKRRYSGILGISEPVSESQKLRYPEQFRDFLQLELKRFCAEKKQKLVVVVDDLDRCEPGTVVEALSAIRQFSDQAKLSDQSPLLGEDAARRPGPGCQFLVPCDEKQVVLALEADGYDAGEGGARYHDYESEELLRKFFDVVVRMDQFVPKHLEEYAVAKATAIGTDEKLSAELIGAVNPHDPREIKKLLNALKVSLERIARSQGEGLLPKATELQEFDRTLLALVALRETTPSVYDEVCVKPATLDLLRADPEIGKKSGEYEKAVVIMERVGPVSVNTAELLMAGQCDPRLIKTPSAISFMYAFRDEDAKRLKEVLSASSPADRRKQFAWATDEIRRAVSAARLRGVLTLLLEYAAEGEEHGAEIADCLRAVVRRRRLLPDALNDHPHLIALVPRVPLLSGSEQEMVYEVVYDNFQKAPDKRDRELRFLLTTASELPSWQKRGFASWLGAAMKKAEGGDFINLLDRLSDALPSSDTKCRGFAPDVAVLLAAKPWSEPEFPAGTDIDAYPRLRLVRVLLGDDGPAAKRVLAALMSPEGVLGSPSPASRKQQIRLAAWKAAELAMTALSPDDAPEMYEHFDKWLRHQTTTEGRRIVLATLRPKVHFLQETQLKALGEAEGNWLWEHEDAEYACDYVGKRPRSRREKQGYDRYTSALFGQLAAHLKSSHNIPPNVLATMKGVAEQGWPVGSVADELLAHKVRQLPSVPNFEQFHDLLGPLIRECEHTRSAVLANIGAGKALQQSLRVGLTTSWRTTLDEEGARALKSTILEHGDDIGSGEDLYEELFTKNGADRLVALAVDWLGQDEKGIDWMQQNESSLRLFSDKAMIASEQHVGVYQSRIKLLVQSADEDLVACGLRILEPMERLVASVKDEIGKWLETRQTEVRKDDQLVQLAQRLQKKPTL